MDLLPLTLSVAVAARSTDDGTVGGQVVRPLGDTCRFCGIHAGGRQVPYRFECEDAGLARVAAACPLCALTQGLDRPTIGQEAVLVWLPEMTQRALIVLVRTIHLTLYRQRIRPAMDRAPLAGGNARAAAAWSAYEALYERRIAAAELLGSNAPRDLAAALLALSPAAYKERFRALAGIRLLPRGRLFENGHDVYPDLLAAWGRDAASKA